MEPGDEMGGIFLQSILCSAQAPVLEGLAELFANPGDDKSGTLLWAQPVPLSLSHPWEALLRGSSFNGVNKHPKQFPVLDREERQRLTCCN